MSDVPDAGHLSFIEKLLRASNNAPDVNGTSMISRSVLKSLASMLGTYNPESDRIEVGARPGVIDDVMSLPSVVDSLTGLTGHGTHMSGDTSDAAAALSDLSNKRRELIAPSRNRAEAGLQGVSDALVSVPGSQPAKLGKAAKIATAIPRVIYDTVIPVMDLSTKTGKAVAAGTSALGAGLGATFYGDPKDTSMMDGKQVDELIEKAKAGDRTAYEQLKAMYPKVN